MQITPSATELMACITLYTHMQTSFTAILVELYIHGAEDSVLKSWTADFFSACRVYLTLWMGMNVLVLMLAIQEAVMLQNKPFAEGP